MIGIPRSRKISRNITNERIFYPQHTTTPLLLHPIITHQIPWHAILPSSHLPLFVHLPLPPGQAQTQAGGGGDFVFVRAAMAARAALSAAALAAISSADGGGGGRAA